MSARSTDVKSSLRELFLVRPGDPVLLAEIDPNETLGHSKPESLDKIKADLKRLASLQERIFAERKHRVLIILQGIDASGKDGTISHVMTGFNPQGCRVVGFDVPSAVELAHDCLWRIHDAVPGNGDIVIFNRSQYESVLVERVHNLVSNDVWSRRYDQINAFEEMLSREGTTIIKFFLHIDRDEQLARLTARYDDPTKRWKFKVSDLTERALWDDYAEAFEDALRKCSTEIAPWYVIPANHKWFRDLAVGDIVADVLDGLRPEYPPGEQLPAGVIIK